MFCEFLLNVVGAETFAQASFSGVAPVELVDKLVADFFIALQLLHKRVRHFVADSLLTFETQHAPKHFELSEQFPLVNKLGVCSTFLEAATFGSIIL